MLMFPDRFYHDDISSTYYHFYKTCNFYDEGVIIRAFCDCTTVLIKRVPQMMALQGQKHEGLLKICYAVTGWYLLNTVQGTEMVCKLCENIIFQFITTYSTYKHYYAKWALILTTVFNMSMALNCNSKAHLKYWENQIRKKLYM